jgi:hypothetical protein
MIQYGEMIESYEPELDNMYRAFHQYFNDPFMHKIKDVDIFSMYMCKTYCLLSKECRYIVTFVDKDNASNGEKIRLSEQRWKSLQTRTLEDKYNLPPHSYNVVARGPLSSQMVKTGGSNESTTYSCEMFPITVTLLNPKKTGVSGYQDRGIIISALETYQTIVTINK